MLFDPRPKERREELYDREEEIEKIKEYVQRYPFTIILGMRRVGKSSILKVVINEIKPAVYIDARKLHFESGGWITSESLIRSLEKEINSMDSSIKRALKYVLQNVEGVSFAGMKIKFDKNAKLGNILESLNNYGRIVIAIDEAQYFRFYGHRGGKEILSLISYAYDNLRNINFIFAGSEVGLLHDFLGIENYDSPLYGRVYGEITVKPFEREVAKNFLIAGFEELKIKIDNPEKNINVMARRINGILQHNWFVFTWFDLQKPMYESFKTTKMLLLFIMMLIVLVAVVNIASALIMMVIEKEADIAILKSTGVGRSSIITAYIYSGFVIGFTGTVIGTGIGLFCAININELIHGIEGILNVSQALVQVIISPFTTMTLQKIVLVNATYYLDRIPIIIDFKSIYTIGAGSLILSTLASVIPAFRAGKVRPMEIIRRQ